MQRRVDRRIDRRVGFLAQRSDERGVRHPQRLAPQIAHLAKLAQHRQVGLALADRELVRVVPSLEIALPCYVAMHEDLRASLRCRAVFDALAAGLKTYLDQSI